MDLSGPHHPENKKNLNTAQMSGVSLCRACGISNTARPLALLAGHLDRATATSAGALNLRPSPSLPRPRGLASLSTSALVQTPREACHIPGQPPARSVHGAESLGSSRWAVQPRGTALFSTSAAARSGHNRWSKIRHRKGAADAARSALFSRLTQVRRLLQVRVAGVGWTCFREDQLPGTGLGTWADVVSLDRCSVAERV